MDNIPISKKANKMKFKINADKKRFASVISVASNTVIIILKITVGILSGSISIISEAMHSCTDLLASVITFFAVTRSSEPADDDHQYGHGKYEDVSGFIEGSLIIIAGFFIIIEASKKLILNNHINILPDIGIIVMGLSAVLNFVISRYLFKISKESNSVSLYADAQHLRTDVFSSSGIMLGLILIKITGIMVLDSIIALIAASIMFKTGFSIVNDTLNDLLDKSLPIEDIEKIRNILKSNAEIKGYKNLRTRKVGHYKNMEVTLFFNPDLKISECHKICDDIECKIGYELSDISVNIHLEPAVSENRSLLKNKV